MAQEGAAPCQCAHHGCACRIGPSMLASDLSAMGAEAKAVLAAGADYLHLDIMDGHFVPNISWGPPVVASLRKAVDPEVFFDCHMMVSNPLQWVTPIKESGGSQYTFHIEACDAEGDRDAGHVCGGAGGLEGLWLAEMPGEPVDWRDYGWRPISPANPSMDVRVREPLQAHEPTDLWMGAANLEDIMGASLVTYDEHLSPLQAEPIIPKAVYLRYETFDPVTRVLEPVVVPAHLTLDAYADPSMFWQPVEEEVEEEEEPPDEEMEDRRKLRSSIKGDPILLRAKPAPPPEPYLAPHRYEAVCTEVLRSQSVPSSPATSRRVRQVPPLRQLEGGDAGADPQAVTDLDEDSFGAETGLQSARLAQRHLAAVSPRSRAYGIFEKPPPEEDTGERKFFSRCVEATATMSSFQKASGRDKYGCSRLREIDRILGQRAPPPGDAVARPPEDWPPGARSAGPGRPRRESRGGGEAAREELEACLATHIRRVPYFHCGRPQQTESASCASREDAAPGAGEGAVADEATEAAHRAAARQSLRKKVPRPVSPADGAAGGVQQPMDGLYDALLAVAPDIHAASPPGSARRAAPRRGAGGRLLGRGAPCATVRLKDLDPHLDASDTAPTQHLHSNWPDGLKRKVARHFYGMTHAQILEEEHRERMRDHRRRSGAKDSGAEDAGDAAGGEGKAGAGEQKRPLSPRKRPQAQVKSARSPRETMAPGGPAVMAHGLEIRIPNADQPSVRVVVSRHTQRLRRKEESAARPTLMLDKISAERKLLSRKY